MNEPPWFEPLTEPTARAVRQDLATRVESYVPEWSARRADDPGVALVKAFAEQVHRQQQGTPSPGRPAKPSGASGWARAADKPEPPEVGTTLPLF